MEFEFRSSGDPPYKIRVSSALWKFTMGVLYKMGFIQGGILCYLDNCVDDYLSLLDLRKIGIALGYEVDLTKKEIGLQIYCKMYDNKGETNVKLIDNNSVICEMVGCITSNRVLVLYYTDKKTSEKTWTQTSVEWPSLQSEEYNIDSSSQPQAQAPAPQAQAQAQG
ncbi:hypothetical protein ACE6H2_021280 [Prunus campanulata]